MEIDSVPFAAKVPFHLSVVFRNRAAVDACDTLFVNQDKNAKGPGGFVCSLVSNLFPRGKALPWKIFISMFRGQFLLFLGRRKLSSW